VQIAADTAVAAWIQGALVDVYLAQGAYFWAHAVISYRHKLCCLGRPSTSVLAAEQKLCVPNPRNYGDKIAHLLRLAKHRVKSVCAPQTG